MLLIRPPFACRNGFVYHNYSVIVRILIFCVVFYTDGTEGEPQMNIANTLAQAICKSQKSPSMGMELKSKSAFPDLMEGSTCTKLKKTKCMGETAGCKPFQSLPCGGAGGGRKKIMTRKGVGGELPGKTSKILGGEKSSREAFPFVVQIRWEPIQPGRKRARCSGTVVSKRWILTSAQCCIIPMRRRNGIPSHAPGIVTFGEEGNEEIDCTNDESWDRSRRIKIESVEVPSQALIDMEEGTVGDPNFDVGLLHTDTVIHTAVVQLADETADCLVEGSKLVGWGKGLKGSRRDPYNPAKIILPPHLYTLDIKPLGKEACAKALERHSHFNPTYRMCARSITAKAETCTSDCGGPMMTPQIGYYTTDSQYKFNASQCAVISRPACEQGKLSARPDVLSLVGPHIGWILKIAD